MPRMYEERFESIGSCGYCFSNPASFISGVLEATTRMYAYEFLLFFQARQRQMAPPPRVYMLTADEVFKRFRVTRCPKRRRGTRWKGGNSAGEWFDQRNPLTKNRYTSTPSQDATYTWIANTLAASFISAQSSPSSVYHPMNRTYKE